MHTSRLKKMKFSDFVNEWRKKYASDLNNLSPSTHSVYESHIKLRLIPTFGHIRIDQINAMQIVTFLKELEKPLSRLDGSNQPLDSGTIGYIFRVLKNIFSRAVDWKVIPLNPMDGIKKPAPKDAKKKLLEQRANPQYFEEKEAQGVVDALYKECRKWRLLILGSMIGGCRLGELIALEWDNVNIEDYTITIENNIPISQQGEAVEKGPKSLASYRVIDMPEWFMDELVIYNREWLLEKKIWEQNG